MRIGIDLDDTVADTNDKLIERALKFDKECVRGRGFKNKDAYTFMEMFYWTVMDVDNFLKSIRKSDFYITINPIPKAAEYVSKLYEEGNEIYFITRRKDCFKGRHLTKKWLKKYGFKYHKLLLGSVKKGEICAENNINYFIDNEENNVIEATSKGVDSILKGTIYNKNEKALNRIEDWEDIYNYINGVKQ